MKELIWNINKIKCKITNSLWYLVKMNWNKKSITRSNQEKAFFRGFSITPIVLQIYERYKNNKYDLPVADLCSYGLIQQLEIS